MDFFIGTEDYFQFVKPYQEAMDFLMVQINVLDEDYREKYRDYPIHNIQSRIKSKESILGKLRRKNLKENFETAKNHLTDIANPKPNGYKSYHIILGVPVYHTDSKEYYPVEVQIRSLTMDLWASMEHRIIYKSPNVDIEKSREVFLKFANELKECENQLFDLKEENNKMGGER